MKEYANSRDKVTRTLDANKHKSKIIQRAYSQYQNADIDVLWIGRSVECQHSRGSMEHNVGYCNGEYSKSAANGHSEMKAIGYYMSTKLNMDIDVHTEREPCKYCKEDLCKLADKLQGGNITAHYLVPYTANDEQNKKALRTTYIRNGNLR